MVLETLDGLEFLREHGIRVPGARARTRATEGADVVVDCRNDPMLGRIVELRSGAHRVHRLTPLDAYQAAAMLGELESKGGIAHDAKTIRTIEHLLLRADAAFAEDAVERVLLAPVRLHDGTYDVLDATVEASRPIHLNRRLDRHARDRTGSIFGQFWRTSRKP